MSQFFKQVLKDTTKETIIKFTGYIDAGGVPTSTDPNNVVVVSLLAGARDANGNPRVLANGAVFNTAANYYETTVQRIYWTLGAVPANGVMQLYWKGNGANSTIFNMGAGVGDTFDMERTGIPFDPTLGTGAANCGDVVLTANGITNGSYTVVLHLRKTGTQYNYGLVMDPGAFRPYTT